MTPRVNHYISSQNGSLFTSCLAPKNHESWGLLIVNPMPHEQNRCTFFHRTLQQNLLKANIPSMRFDYSGTGDSTGSIGDSTIEHWIHDTDVCYKAFMKNLDLDFIYLLGTRIGGTIANTIASRDSNLIPILIDPIYSGKKHIKELESLQRDLLFNPLEAPFANNTKNEVMGFSFPEKIRQSIESIRIDDKFSEIDHLFFSQENGDLNHYVDEDFGWNDIYKLRLQFIPKLIQQKTLGIIGGEL